jgi:hypothetical protein
VSSSHPTPGEGRHLRLIRTGGTPGGGKAVHAALLCVLWLAIVWLLFASFVDTGSSDRTNVPGKSQPAQHRLPTHDR